MIFVGLGGNGDSQLNGLPPYDNIWPHSSSLEFYYTDANGQKVRQFTVQADKAGEVSFEWDGRNDAGERLPAGTYGVTATHGTGESKKSLSTYVESRVQSVTVGTDGVFLDLPGLQDVAGRGERRQGRGRRAGLGHGHVRSHRRQRP